VSRTPGRVWPLLVRDGRARLGLAVVLVLGLAALLAPLLARHDPTAIDLAGALRPPSGAHWLGTDVQGRDVWARLVHGARVSLAVALLGQPDLLVLDEPTVGLDPVLRRQLWSTFSDLAAAGTTIIVSSHVMDEAQRCDRLLLMREGALIADDSPEALLQSTGTADVESAFLSLIEAEVSS